MLIRHMARSTRLSVVSSPSRMSLGKAIEEAIRRSPLSTQEVLALELGVDQTTISKYVRGAVAVSVERISQIEDVCGEPRGSILVRAGYVDLEQRPRRAASHRPDPADDIRPTAMRNRRRTQLAANTGNPKGDLGTDDTRHRPSPPDAPEST